MLLSPFEKMITSSWVRYHEFRSTILKWGFHYSLGCGFEALTNLNGIRVKSYLFMIHLNTVFSGLLLSNAIWWFLLVISLFENILAHANLSSVSSIFWIRYLILVHTLFKGRNPKHILRVSLGWSPAQYMYFMVNLI